VCVAPLVRAPEFEPSSVVVFGILCVVVRASGFEPSVAVIPGILFVCAPRDNYENDDERNPRELASSDTCLVSRCLGGVRAMAPRLRKVST
jgi:hypothetical protein